jgi:hypothetical protein
MISKKENVIQKYTMDHGLYSRKFQGLLCKTSKRNGMMEY